jgi:hypothetical protein
VPLFNTGSYTPTRTFREEVAENVEGAPGSTFIMVKWESGAWYRECVTDSDAAAHHEGRRGGEGNISVSLRGVCISSAPIGRIFMKFDTGDFHINVSSKSKFE